MVRKISSYSNLTQRVIAAIIGAAVLITCIAYGPYSYFIIFLVLCILAQLEFYKLTGLDGMVPLKSYGTFLGALMFTLVFLIEMGHIKWDYLFILFPFFAGIFLIKLYKKQDKKPFTNIGITFLGLIYVALPLCLLTVSAFHKGSYTYELVLGLLLILWASDTGAYFAGTKFGKTKLFERVSPKKSWEGSIGGLILALAMSMGIYYFTELFTAYHWGFIALLVVIAGTYGDLVESLFKRSIAIKDSGSFIPGHGGFLDRFDGLLLATPFIVVFLRLFPL
ncbi:MAG: phosphatidate cytidylyltransferase [Cyclobacteriaceae bacterium]|nr:phosphatidate cytidylyltransferase [Cyclobacteriaceae bacterium]MCH8515636.1 phosphatidate cytidylyltransferase [Cyclobacteriaceae bacterium]